MSRLPYAKIEAPLSRRIAGLSGRLLNLYRVIGNHPPLLKAWVEFAFALRHEVTTSRVLRELMILRTAQLAQSAYEWHQHRIMAREAGVPEEKVAELAMWQVSTVFDERERVALALTEGIVAGRVDDELFAAVSKEFNHGEVIELVLTASFYVMVPRILDAIGVTPEGE